MFGVFLTAGRSVPLCIPIVLSFITVEFILSRVLFSLMGKTGDGIGEELPFSENFGTPENKIYTMTLSPLIC